MKMTIDDFAGLEIKSKCIEERASYSPKTLGEINLESGGIAWKRKREYS